MRIFGEVFIITIVLTCTSGSNINMTLTHGKESKTVSRIARSRPIFLNAETTMLKTDKFPNIEKLRPSIGNGYLATVVHSDTIYRSDAFNGYNLTSHRARIPSTCSIHITSISRHPNSIEYCLDIGRGIYGEYYDGNMYGVEMNMYAHRKYSQLMVTEIQVWNSHDSEDLVLSLYLNSGNTSIDLDIVEETLSQDKTTKTFHAQTKEAEYERFGKQEIVVISSNVPKVVTVKPGSNDSYLFLTAVSNSEMKAKEAFAEGKAAFFNQTLESSHIAAWSEIWRNGRIDMIGNDLLTKQTYSALYYILSSIPDSPAFQKYFVGLSPGSLANGAAGKDYYGHVFWDQETWMYPPVLMLQSALGKALVKTRIRTLDSAIEYAASRGYKGAMYTWESAYTGLDVCPAERYSHYEQHITGDVALAIQQYMRMSRDSDFLSNERGAEAIQNIAAFWASRVRYNNTTDLYDINGVMPPDEYHFNINNSAYTNAVAKISLQLVKEFATTNNQSTIETYQNIAQKIKIPLDSSGNWHLEFDGYKKGETVKQADVILMGYPLMYDMPAEVRKNDLSIYGEVTPGGPAMTWSMFSIGWMEVGNFTKANELFLRQLINKAGPFNIWTEVANGQGAVNFITGMGGYLQSVIFGYGGFRIFSDHLHFEGNLPPNTTTFNIYGLDYLGGSMDFSFTEANMVITQTKMATEKLAVVTGNDGISHTLKLGTALTLPRQKASISVFKASSVNTVNTNAGNGLSFRNQDDNSFCNDAYLFISSLILINCFIFSSAF